MTPIERAARAIARIKADWQYGSDTKDADRDQFEEDWHDSIDDARTVLAAIRVPSEAMIYASSEGGLGFNDRVISDWQAMIDAALVEG